MKINTKSLNKFGVPWIILIVGSIASFLGLLISAFPIFAVLISIVLIVLLLTPFFINNLEFLFYVFMASFALGEVGVHIASYLPKISFSNLWLLYTIFIIFLHLIIRGRDQAVFKISKRKMILLIVGFFLIVMVIFSSVINESYRGLITQVGYFLVIILISVTVDQQRILNSGIYLAFLSVYALSLLTILTSLGILSFGYRVIWNSGLAPWESILPRAIGLPQMDGGIHNAFIVSILPVSIGLYQQRKGKSILGDLISLIGIFLCVVAVFVSQFRSGWLGLVIALTAMLYFYWRYTPSETRKIFLTVIMIIVLVGCVFIIALEFEAINNYYQQFFFEVRSGGINKRLAQYQFALRTIPSSLKSMSFGFGYNAIREDFPGSPEAYNLRNALDIGLHNHFLGYMYAYGILFLIGYLFIFFKAGQWLYSDLRNPRNNTSWLSSGLLAGLLGIAIIAFFNVSLSGYKILWVIFSFAAIIPEINE